jgi:hypothetical protein
LTVIISTGGVLPGGVLACGGHPAVQMMFGAVPEQVNVRNPVLVASTNGEYVLITYVRNVLGSKGL